MPFASPDCQLMDYVEKGQPMTLCARQILTADRLEPGSVQICDVACRVFADRLSTSVHDHCLMTMYGLEDDGGLARDVNHVLSRHSKEEKEQALSAVLEDYCPGFFDTDVESKGAEPKDGLIVRFRRRIRGLLAA